MEKHSELNEADEELDKNKELHRQVPNLTLGRASW